MTSGPAQKLQATLNPHLWLSASPLDVLHGTRVPCNVLTSRSYLPPHTQQTSGRRPFQLPSRGPSGGTTSDAPSDEQLLLEHVVSECLSGQAPPAPPGAPSTPIAQLHAAYAQVLSQCDTANEPGVVEAMQVSGPQRMTL